MTIDRFIGEYAFLSNFWSLDDGKTLEHYFQAAKTEKISEWYHVFQADTPQEAKRRGREVSLREDWDEVKDGVMLDLLRSKFSQPYLREKLLDTGDEYLIEGNTWRDTYWGADLATGVGQNKLGLLLMQVRDELKETDNDNQ